jgi:hypothetical protein
MQYYCIRNREFWKQSQPSMSFQIVYISNDSYLVSGERINYRKVLPYGKVKKSS